MIFGFYILRTNLQICLEKLAIYPKTKLFQFYPVNLKKLKTKISMKKLFLALLTGISLSATAQIRLPQPSPGASVSQVVGTTDISVKYSRPLLRGRDVFGGVVPFDKVWRTGANGTNQITFSNDVMVAGQKLAAGSYSIFSIPTKGDWTLIFNKDLSAQEYNYSQEKDALRVTVKSTTVAKTEAFTIDFSGLSDSTADMNISWSDKKVIAPITVETTKMVEAAITKTSNDNAGVMRTAADYLSGKGKLDQALKLVNTSIAGAETFRNVWSKAQILSKLGNYAEALPLAQKALALGGTDPGFAGIKGAVEKGIADYTSKLPVVVAPVLKKKK
jgi:VCBS repeat-containing protein